MYNTIKPLKDLDTTSVERQITSTLKDTDAITEIRENSIFIAIQKRLKSGPPITEFIYRWPHNYYYAAIIMAIDLSPPYHVSLRNLLKAFSYEHKFMFYYFIKSIILHTHSNKIKDCSLKNLITVICLKK